MGAPNYYLIYDPIAKIVLKTGQIQQSKVWLFIELPSLYTSQEGIVYGMLNGGTVGYFDPSTYSWISLDTYPGPLELWQDLLVGWAFLGKDIYFVTYSKDNTCSPNLNDNWLIKYTRKYN